MGILLFNLMKINISIQPEDIGYHNISPINGDNPFDLQINDNECTEIIADNILDYIPHSQLIPVLTHYVSKMRHGGKIILGGTDLIESMKVLLSDMNIEESNSRLFGNQKHIWDFKKGGYTCDIIAKCLQSLGLRIILKRIENCRFIVEAKRD